MMCDDEWEHFLDTPALVDSDTILGGTNPRDREMPILQSIENEFGSKGYDILDSSGRPIRFDKTNAEQMAKLGSRGLHLAA